MNMMMYKKENSTTIWKNRPSYLYVLQKPSRYKHRIFHLCVCMNSEKNHLIVVDSALLESATCSLNHNTLELVVRTANNTVFTGGLVCFRD